MELDGRTVEKWICDLMEIIKEPSHWIFAIIILVIRYSPIVQFTKFLFFRLFYFSLFISSSQHSIVDSVCMNNEHLTCTQNVINVHDYCMQSLPSFSSVL